MFYNDRFTMGFLGGTIGAVVMNILDYVSYYVFHFSRIRFLDYAAVVIYGSYPTSLKDTVFALIVQILFTAMLSIVFAYLFPVISGRNYLFKGWIFGIMAWFAIYAVGMLFDLPMFERILTNTAISHFIISSIYGIVLAISLKRMEAVVKPGN